MHVADCTHCVGLRPDCFTGHGDTEASVDEADIENVNPESIAAKQGSFAAFSAGPDLSAPAAAPAVPDQALSDSPPLSGSAERQQAAAPEAAPAASSKPFVSSKVLSEALFGTGDSSTATALSAAKSPTSPFAEASTVSPAPGAGANVRAGAGKRPGAVPGTTLDERVSSGVQRPDGTPRDSGNAERIEEALMSSASPFSRRLSSEEVKPIWHGFLSRIQPPSKKKSSQVWYLKPQGTQQREQGRVKFHQQRDHRLQVGCLPCGFSHDAYAWAVSKGLQDFCKCWICPFCLLTQCSAFALVPYGLWMNASAMSAEMTACCLHLGDTYH